MDVKLMDAPRECISVPSKGLLPRFSFLTVSSWAFLMPRMSELFLLTVIMFKPWPGPLFTRHLA